MFNRRARCQYKSAGQQQQNMNTATKTAAKKEIKPNGRNNQNTKVDKKIDRKHEKTTPVEETKPVNKSRFTSQALSTKCQLYELEFRIGLTKY